MFLMGSRLNPLSALAARYFHERGDLDLVIVPAKLPSIWGGGVPYILSMILVGIYRHIHILLRRLRMKKQAKYLSLTEFLCANPEIPTMEVVLPDFDLDAMVQHLGEQKQITDNWWVSCIFPLKIRTKEWETRRVLNIHPGILPENRGPNPYFWCLAKNHLESGITYHRVTSKIDQGPILYRFAFPVPPRISEYRLESMTVRALEQSLPMVWEQLNRLWPERQPQDKGFYYPEPTAHIRRKYGIPSTFSIPFRRNP